MKTFVKNYIGKGKHIAGLQIVKVTCKLEDLQKYAYEYDGIQYVTFEVAKMKSTDSFGRDHTVYVSNRIETEEPAIKQEEEPAPQPEESPAMEKEPVGEIQF